MTSSLGPSSNYPAIKGYAFHSTGFESALRILKAGYLRPFLGDISFTLDPCFSVAYPGLSFVFLEKVLREKYGAKEPEFRWIEDPEKRKEAWAREMEITVKDRLVYVSDCVDLLEGRPVCWKYGYKYRFVDIRDRRTRPWQEFSRLKEV